MQKAILVAALACGACTQPGQGPGGTGASILGPEVRAALEPGAAEAASGEARFAVAVSGASAADCRADGEGFAAAFRAPAVLVVPTYGGASRPVSVSCEAMGRRFAQSAAPSVVYANGIGGWPAVSVGVGTGGGNYVSVGGFWNGGWGAQPTSARVRYPDLTFAFQ